MSQRYPAVRRWGQPPFRAAVIHGGPGAPGYMAPVARRLSLAHGVLEPLQKGATLHGQLQELEECLEANGQAPYVLIGSSWGAVLGFLFAAQCPQLVAKLIMVGSAPFDEAGATAIETTRLSRLDEADRLMAENLRRVLIEEGDVDQSFRRLVDLYTKADAYDPVTLDTETLEMQFEVNQQVWAEARRLRASGELLAYGQAVQCPVVAVHGDYDPHPADSVFLPLVSVLSHFRPVLLDRCGHLPWLERHAKEHFFEILAEELAVT